MIPDTRGWTPIGRSSNAAFYEVEPQLLAVVPYDGASDDEASATESVRIQLDHLRARATRAAVLVYVDGIVAQTAGARTVYRELPDPAYQVCFALIGGTPFGRAIASLFVGLRPPRVPTRFFATEGEAIAWTRSMTTPRS